ncbi:hypothetical protein N0V93_002637 [Gnomoniopsis smithogilvyi]|uniref:Uncharacterized protein n=1 Tax=Gnomoniopsis smithogilvyi TaxID=1191159 RepID=A0A9W8YZ12_9PEZI|nr:hypothetical protein N0V93_002637 [Gnomoniopsis smithogilvyi]
MANDLVELGKDRVGEGMQLLRPELPIAFNAVLTVLLVILEAWAAHYQKAFIASDDFEGDEGDADRGNRLVDSTISLMVGSQVSQSPRKQSTAMDFADPGKRFDTTRTRFGTLDLSKIFVKLLNMCSNLYICE